MISKVTAMFNLKTYLNHHRSEIDQALKKYIGYIESPSHMAASIEYALMGSGKRVRPVLCLASCTALDADSRQAIPAACAIEMIHTYSLIHDDLPALDDDALRRGRPTCHVKFDEATAVLAGDALLTMAFEVLADAGIDAGPEKTGIWMKVISVIGHAAGCRGMVEGQARDLAYEGKTLTRDQLEKMHSLKTGALIRASVVSGGLIGQADPQQLDQLTLFSDCIGLAFQVMDDILNVTGDPELLGKAVGTDVVREKNTYPGLMGLEASKAYAASLIDDALRALSHFDNKADPLRAIARYFVERNK
jgi:geranylgeranyl diphosphate synthase type II